MTISIQNTQAVQQRRSDITHPPTPTIATSIAFDRLSARGQVMSSSPSGAAPSVPRDPLYIELHNVEGGTTFELVNLSKKPDATFKDAIELSPTGRDLVNRTASVYLTEQQMEQLDLKPGDIYLLRAKDSEGNVSAHVRGELEPNDWGNQTVRDQDANGRWIGQNAPGRQFSMLDGESERKNIVARVVNDGRPAVVLEDRLVIETRTFSDDEVKAAKVLQANLAALKTLTGVDGFKQTDIAGLLQDATLSPEVKDALKVYADPKSFDKVDDAHFGGDSKDGSIGRNDLAAVATGAPRVYMRADLAMEPDAVMNVQNQRTGARFDSTVSGEGKLTIVFPTDTRSGDPIILRPRDHEGNAGKEIRLTYKPDAKDGKAPVVSPLQSRLAGVI